MLPPDATPAETGLDTPAILAVETFDGFTYELRIGKLMGDNYPVLIPVKADLPKERAAAANEKPEEKTTRDQQFQTKQKAARRKTRAGREARRPSLPDGEGDHGGNC